MRTYKCSTCQQQKPATDFYRKRSGNAKRPVTYECRDCKRGRGRAADSFRRALRKWGTVCDWCLWPKRLTPTGACKDCLKEAGARWCSRCSTALPLEAFGGESDDACRQCVGELFEFEQEEAKTNRKIEGNELGEVALRHRYSMTREQYQALALGGCWICGEQPPGNRWLQVDESSVGQARLLCARCSGALHLLRRSPELVGRAAAYLAPF